MSFAEKFFSMIGRLGSDRIKHAGKRGNRIILGIVMTSDSLLTQAKLPAARRGSVGISPALEKLCLNEMKISGVKPAKITRVISEKSFKSSVWCLTKQRINNIPPTRAITKEIFLPRWIKIMFLT